MLLPFANLLERLSLVIIKPDEEEERQARENELFAKMDERFLSTPSFALEQVNSYVLKMAELTKESLNTATYNLFDYDKKSAGDVEQMENLVDRYDDEISGYLVKLSSRNLSEADSRKLNMLQHSVGDLERISDHAMNLVHCARVMNKKEQHFSEKAAEELKIFSQAVRDIVEISVRVFEKEDAEAAKSIEPFEEAIDILQKEMKKRHMKRLRKGKCTAEMGFVLSDITNNYERIADHCSNLAINVMQMHEDDTHAHAYIDNLDKGAGSAFDTMMQEHLKRYELPGKAAKE